MNTFYGVLILLSSIIFGYIVGSIPTGLIISKAVFNIDIRDYGSHSIGGTNSGRIMGKKIGMIVILLDMVKLIIPFLTTFFVLTLTPLKGYCLANMPEISYYSCSTAVILGHCFPIFASFKGGKAVACNVGSFIATSYILFPGFLISFLICLKCRKMVSLGSIIGSSIAFLLSLLVFVPGVTNYVTYPGMAHNFTYPIMIFLQVAILIFRHRKNIVRISKKEESKITWMK